MPSGIETSSSLIASPVGEELALEELDATLKITLPSFGSTGAGPLEVDGAGLQGTGLSQNLHPLQFVDDGAFSGSCQSARLSVIGEDDGYLEPVCRSSRHRDSQVVGFPRNETRRQMV